MVLRGIKSFFIPLICFTCMVSTGFASWVFMEQQTYVADFSSLPIYITDMKSNIGDIVVNNVKNYENPYELIFEIGDGEALEDINQGISLSNDIEYKFYNFYYPEDGYAYYLSYAINYVTDGFYSQYVRLASSFSIGQYEQDSPNYGKSYQLSNEVLLDSNLFKDSSIKDPDGISYYEYNDSLDIQFVWVEGSKPITASSYSDFLSKLNTQYSNESIQIVINIEYKKIV